MLTRENTVLVIVDVQEKLARVMHERERLFEGLRKLIQGARVLDVPIILLEQNPDGLGPTVAPVAEVLEGIEPIVKMSFSGTGEGRFTEALRKTGRKQVLLGGIEAHVCVYQTAADLVQQGYEVQVVVDAVSSRTPENRGIALERIKAAGASLTSVETALLEILGRADDPCFKAILKIVK
jgi:nicotinamidase-related amidase